MNQRALQRIDRLPMHDLNDVIHIGDILARSGFFQDVKEAAQAVAKILYGQELGVPPVQAMLGIHIIQGKPAPSAGLIASIIKRSGKYNYRVKQINDERCDLEFFEDGQSVGVSTFTHKDAEAAGALTGKNAHTWKSFKRNMLFARALSNGARWYCPDVFGGPVYTPEEMDVAVDGETGEILRPLAAVMTLPGKPGEPDREPKNPHPLAEDTGERYHGEILWKVGGVVCVSREAAKGGRYLQSTQQCPLHDRPFFLGPDDEPDSWAHGKGDDRCVLVLGEDDAGTADELPAADPVTPAGFDKLTTSEKREPRRANAKQVEAIYEAGGVAGMDAPETDRLSAIRFQGRGPADLSSREASEFLAVLREG